MLIIYAHPNRDGHCGYILNRVEKELKKKNVNYEILDLYGINYDPVMKNEEHYTSGHYEISEQNKEFQKKCLEENKFIIIYPTWWNGVPAILKGFFDRVLVSRVAFRYEGAIPKGLLFGKAVVFTTTGGPLWAEKILMKSRGIKAVCKDTLKFCGLKAKGYMIGSCRKLDERKKWKIEKVVGKGIKKLMHK